MWHDYPKWIQRALGNGTIGLVEQMWCLDKLYRFFTLMKSNKSGKGEETTA